MSVDYNEFLNKVIDDGIEAAKEDYASRPEKLKGSIEGFEACRGKNPLELAEVLKQASKKTHEARMNRVPNYWEIRCFEAEVEWVCNCVSAILMNQGLPTIISPTARGYMKAAQIVGVESISSLN